MLKNYRGNIFILNGTFIMTFVSNHNFSHTKKEQMHLETNKTCKPTTRFYCSRLDAQTCSVSITEILGHILPFQ